MTHPHDLLLHQRTIEVHKDGDGSILGREVNESSTTQPWHGIPFREWMQRIRKGGEGGGEAKNRGPGGAHERDKSRRHGVSLLLRSPVLADVMMTMLPFGSMKLGPI